MVSHIEQIGQECTDATSIRLLGCSHNQKILSTENQAKNVQNPFLFNDIRDGTLLLQVILGGTGTPPKAGGAHEFNFFKMFVAVGFVYSWQQSTVTDGKCRQYTSHVFFLCTMRVLNNVLHNTLAQVSARARFISSTWSSTLCGCPFFDSLFLTLFPSVCFSYLFFFYLNPELNLFLHVVVIGATYGIGTPPNVHSTPHTSLFFRSQRTLLMMCDTTLAQVLVRVIRSMCHAPEWLSVLCLSLSLRSSLCSLPCVSLSSSSSSWTLTSTISSSMWTSSEQDPLCTSPNEESGPLTNNAPLTGNEPNLFDDFHYSETTGIFLQEQSSDTMPSYLHDAELSDETIGRALSSPLFIQEREEPAGRRQAYHSFEESLLPSQSLSVCHVRTVRPVHGT